MALTMLFAPMVLTPVIYNMTFGGPGTTTQLVATTLYRRALGAFNMGWSSAPAVILLLISIAFTATFIFVLHWRDKEWRDKGSA